MSPKVQVSVSVALPGDKHCNTLSVAARASIQDSFCDNTVKASSMDQNTIQCKASISCGARRQAAGRSLQTDNKATLDADFQVVTKSESAINTNNAAASSIATTVTKEAAGIVKGIIPGATATVDEVSTTKGAKPPAEGPASSGSACSFSGTYTIRPLYAPCSRKYLSYTYGRACSSKSKSITLRASKQVRPGKHSLNWDLNGTGTVPVVGSELSSCKNRALSAPSKPGKRMKLGAGTWSWRVVPRKAGDCSKVNLYSSKRKGYLALDSKCRKFSYSSKPNSKATLWRVTKRK